MKKQSLNKNCPKCGKPMFDFGNGKLACSDTDCQKQNQERAIERQWHAYNSQGGNIFKLWRISDGSSKAVCIICAREGVESEMAIAEHVAKAHNDHAALIALRNHIMSMADDAYLTGHPEWLEIVAEAERLPKT